MKEPWQNAERYPQVDQNPRAQGRSLLHRCRGTAGEARQLVRDVRVQPGRRDADPGALGAVDVARVGGGLLHATARVRRRALLDRQDTQERRG